MGHQQTLLKCSACGFAVVVDEGATIRFFSRNHRTDKATGRVTGNCINRTHRGRRSFTCNQAFSYEPGQPDGETAVVSRVSTRENNSGHLTTLISLGTLPVAAQAI